MPRNKRQTVTRTQTRTVRPARLSAAERDHLTADLYAVQSEVFAGVDRAAFRTYVVDSSADETWIELVYANDELVGYCALHRFDIDDQDGPLTVFRAEAGLKRAYRARGAVGGLMVREISRARVRQPTRRMVYLGSLVHPSSYCGLARAVSTVWPHPERPTPPATAALMGRLADRFGLTAPSPSRPLVRHVGWRTRDTAVEAAFWSGHSSATSRFFRSQNPGYAEGLGLVTLVPLDWSNLRSGLAGRAARAARRWATRARTWMQRLPLGALRMARAQVLAAIDATPTLAGAGTVTRSALARIAEPRLLAAGHYLMHEGDDTDAAYFIASGVAHVVRSGSDDGPLATLGRGGVVGEMGVVSGAVRTASVRAVKPTTVLRIPASRLAELMRHDPALDRAVRDLHEARSRAKNTTA